MGIRERRRRGLAIGAVVAGALVVASLPMNPAAVAAPAEPVTVTMAFSGDILPHRPVLSAALRYGNGAYDFRPMFARIAPLVSSVDLAICHLETPIAPPGEPLSYHPLYGVPREIVDGIASAGYDRCSTASNHAFDRGTSGIDATVDALEAAGIGSSGMARSPAEAEPQVFTVKGVRFSQLNYTFSINGLRLPPDEPWRVRFLDPDRIVADAQLARARGAEYVIVNLHWGIEKDWRVSAAQRALAEVLTASGAVDLIVGEHVHVLQPIEQVNGRWVVYGTSNLLSNLPGPDPAWPASAQDGAIVTVAVSRAADGTITTNRPVVHPTWVDDTGGFVIRPVLADLSAPDVPTWTRARLTESLARTRSVLGPYVATAPAGPVPVRCAVELPTSVPVTGFAPAATPSVFFPTDPARILDTRTQGDAGYLCPQSARTIPVAGRGPVPPSGASAVALTVTAVAAGGPGFVTVWPAGAARPYASSLNLTATDQVRPNLVIVPLGERGEISVYSQSGAHLVLDVSGWFVPSGPASAGRIVPVTPSRLLDTRDLTGPTAPKGGARVAGGATVTVPVAGRGGVPETGVGAVVVNLTGTDATAAGFVTAWPSGTLRPEASNVNLSGPGSTAATLAIVRLGADGALQLFTQYAAHLVVDVTGYVTGSGAAIASEGRFVPLTPVRAFDTRGPSPVPLLAGDTRTFTHTGNAGVPDSGVGGVALNVTAVDAAAPGYVTAYPAAPVRPLASTVNVVASDVRPNAAVLPVDPAGKVSYFSQSGTHLVVDVTGYLTGGPT
ncbi:MAG: CapA family protein [Acidimicrobiales bacterium]